MSDSILILTGPAGAGKSTVADALMRRSLAVQHVGAVTTRSPRPDDRAGHYEHISYSDFDALEASSSTLFVSATYSGHRYGVRQSVIDACRASGRRPVLTLTPDSSARVVEREWLDSGHRDSIISIFLDAPDSELDRRLIIRRTLPDEAQRTRDRQIAEEAPYKVENIDLDNTVLLVENLWRHYGRGGVVTRRLLELMLRGGMLLDSADEQEVQGASYDLRLGDEYYYGGEIRFLSNTRPILTIEPYDYAIVTSKERSKLPRDVSGRFDLAVGLFTQGVILSNGPQIDPGFRGNLFLKFRGYAAAAAQARA